MVEALLGGPQRFNDLLGQIPGLAANILSERLKRLEREELLMARPYSEIGRAHVLNSSHALTSRMPSSA